MSETNSRPCAPKETGLLPRLEESIDQLIATAERAIGIARAIDGEIFGPEPPLDSGDKAQAPESKEEAIIGRVGSLRHLLNDLVEVTGRLKGRLL